MRLMRPHAVTVWEVFSKTRCSSPRRCVIHHRHLSGNCVTTTTTTTTIFHRLEKRGRFEVNIFEKENVGQYIQEAKAEVCSVQSDY